MKYARSRRWFRLAQRIAPHHLRASHGDEMERLFVETLERERERLGWLAYGFVWFGIVKDLLGHAWRDGVVVRGRGRARHGPGSHGPVEATWHDMAYAARTLTRRPGFTGLVVGTLALGIGATVAIFSVLNGVLLAPLPYPNPDALVAITEANASLGRERVGAAPGNILDWRERTEAFETIGAGFVTSGTFQDGDYAEELPTGQVTEEFFDVLGVPPHLGRTFRDGDDLPGGGALVLGYRFWQRHFGGDSAVINRVVNMSAAPLTIVGVMPPGFGFLSWDVEVWASWDLRVGYARLPEVPRDWRFLEAVGRLRPGYTAEQGEADLNRIAAGLAERFPATNRGWETRLDPLHETTVGDARQGLLVASGAVGFILLLSCVNVANLLFARVPSRSREMAVRSALGASRTRMVRQLMAENLLLSLVGGVLALAVGFGMVKLLIAVDAGNIPRLQTVSVDLTVFVFAALVVTGVGVACGIAPVWHATRVGGGSLRSAHTARSGESRGARRVRGAFVVVEVALALLLVVGAGLFTTSLYRIRVTDPGFNPDNLLTFRLSLNSRPGESGYIAPYYRAVVDSLTNLPGVVAAGASTTLPLNPVGNDFTRPFRRLGEATPSAEAATVNMRIVTSGFFRAMDMAFREGDTFAGTERVDDPRVAVINQTFADGLWPGERVVGRVFEVDFRDGWQPYRVIGVVRDVRHYGQRRPAQPEVYLGATQTPYLAMTAAVRVSGDPELLVPAVQRALRAIKPDQPAHNFVTMEQLVGESVAEERFLVVLLSVFGGVALALAASGVYGLMSYSVNQRVREIGLRMALGARREVVMRYIVGRALALAGAGLAIGLLAMLWLGRTLQGLLFGIEARSPVLLGGVAFLLASVSLVAAFIPAKRAAGIDPVTALRGE